MVTTRWTRAHVAAIGEAPSTHAPVIAPGMVEPILPGVDFWDLWPVREPNGAVAGVCGAQLWAGLSALASGHPGARHDWARIRLIWLGGAGWVDLGPLFPDGASPGSREWAGSLEMDPATGGLSAYYTATGERAEPKPTFRQRIMATGATLGCAGRRPVVSQWGPHQEIVVADGVRYLPAADTVGEPGFIKAFRDPFVFHDPASGMVYLLFTASMASAATDFNGCIGMARADADGWKLLDPLVTADGVNTELERPHLVVHDGRYYLFFSTQRRTFHPDLSAPTGLYGFTASNLLGPYGALNVSGLVLQNPPAEPYQAYSWLVLNDLRTVSFVDWLGLAGRQPDDLKAEGERAERRHFGGTMAPVLRLGLRGDQAWVADHDVGLREN